MKAFLVTLLAATLCVERGHSLLCYACHNESSNQECMKIAMCAKEDKYCVTIRDMVGAGKGQNPEVRISKMCSPECPQGGLEEGKTTTKVFCCDKPLCNVNGASSTKTSYSMISLGMGTVRGQEKRT
nr:lymphocyte antigen 6E-like [Pelodiscus sinensis]|eukprot:XP_025041848.1 lymphocyte antigen 6E-like [Pelodiscus sinensis]